MARGPGESKTKWYPSGPEIVGPHRSTRLTMIRDRRPIAHWHVRDPQIRARLDQAAPDGALPYVEADGHLWLALVRGETIVCRLPMTDVVVFYEAEEAVEGPGPEKPADDRPPLELKQEFAPGRAASQVDIERHRG